MCLTTQEWDWLKRDSRSKTIRFQVGWWHNKYYRDNPPNDGFALQVSRGFEQAEVPYKRKIFYPSPASRLSLGPEYPVAYFSADFGTNCCETIDQLSTNSKLSGEELSRYLAGDFNPTPGWHGFPIKYYLAADALILDLTHRNAAFFIRVQENTNQDEADALWSLVTSFHPRDKKETQSISIEAHKHGFDGIFYSSVRAPVDTRMPDRNLVVFQECKIQRGKGPED